MLITWHGQACFKIQSKNHDEVTIATDPFDKTLGLKVPRIAADIATISHDHYDHNNRAAIKGEPFFIDTPGEYERKGVYIYGIASWHDDKEGSERGTNIIYRFEMEEMSVVHLGDLGHVLSNLQLERLQNVDILLIPVGGVYTIDAKKAVEVINQIEPRIVIPMHFKVPGIKEKIDGSDKFCKEIGVCPTEKLDKYRILKKDLPQEETRVVLLKNV